MWAVQVLYDVFFWVFFTSLKLCFYHLERGTLNGLFVAQFVLLHVKSLVALLIDFTQKHLVRYETFIFNVHT